MNSKTRGMLTNKQAECLRHIRNRLRETKGQIAPTTSELAEKMGCSRNNVQQYINALVAHGKIAFTVTRQRRIIRILK